MKRTKITKNSLESIVEYCEDYDLFFYEVSEYFHVNITLNPVKVKIVLFSEDEELERDWEFIDEITQLLTSLTGKTQFYKK